MSDKREHIVLVGMPGSGKSTIGKLLAERRDMNFVDVDDVIRERYDATLEEIIDEHGPDAFVVMEGDVCASLELVGPTVIAPGGSAVYSDHGMGALSELGVIVFVDPTDEELAERLGDLRSRGVVVVPGQTLSDLVAYRRPFYERWAEIHLETEGMAAIRAARLIDELVDALS